MFLELMAGSKDRRRFSSTFLMDYDKGKILMRQTVPNTGHRQRD
jgi:hypothetical protein